MVGTGVIRKGGFFTLHRPIGWSHEWPHYMQNYLSLLSSCLTSCSSEEVIALTFITPAESTSLEVPGWMPLMCQFQEAPLHHWVCGEYGHYREIPRWSLHTRVSTEGCFHHGECSLEPHKNKCFGWQMHPFPMWFLFHGNPHLMKEDITWWVKHNKLSPEELMTLSILGH